MDQLVVFDGGHDRLDIGHDSGAFAPEWYPAEASDQWLLTVIALHRDLETGPGPVGGVDARLVPAGHLRDGGLVLPQGKGKFTLGSRCDGP
jgi:hypothetical protein